MGVLAFQGSVQEHVESLKDLGVNPVLVKSIKHLDKVSGLIIPGGESTTIGHFLKLEKLDEYLKEKILAGFPVYGTCAGLIVLSKEIINGKKWQNVLSVLDVSVIRNGFGRQVDSFQDYISIPDLKINKFEAVFIRAPIIEKLLSNKVKVLSKYKDKIIFVRQDNILASSFHPELTKDLSIHKYFLDIIKQKEAIKLN